MRATARLRSSTASAFEEPSTKKAVSFLEAWGKERPVVLVANDGRDSARQVVPQPRARGHRAAVGARGRGRRLGPLPARHRGRSRVGTEASRKMSLHPNEVLLAPVVSEKSYSLIEDRKYSFKVHKDAHKTQVRQAVEQLFGVKVTGREHRPGPVEAEDAQLQEGLVVRAGRRRSCSSKRATRSRSSKGLRSKWRCASSSRPLRAAAS